MRALRRQAEDVGGELHRRIALRTAAGHAQALDARAGALLDALLALAQRVGQAFEDGAIDMRAGVHVAETDDRALGFQPRLADARRPVGLQHQPHGTGWHRLHQLVEQLFRLDAQLPGALHLAQAELALEPADHPEAAVDHHLGVEATGDRRRIGRDQRDGLQVAAAGGVDGRRGAVGQAGHVRLDGAGAEHFAGLVGTRGDQRQPLGNAGVPAGLGADAAESFAGFEQLRQLLAADLHRLPLPVARPGPAQAFVVERQVGDAARQRIDEAPAQPVGEIAGEQQHLVRTRMDFRLLLGDPVDLRLAAEIIHSPFRPGQPEQPAPGSPDAPLHIRPALVQPDDGRAQRPAFLVDMNDRGALGGERYSADPAAVDIDAAPQRLAGFAELLPVVLRVLLRPAGLRRAIGLQLHPPLAQQVALQVEQQRAHALGAVVDGEQVVRFAQDAVLIVVCSTDGYRFAQPILPIPIRDVGCITRQRYPPTHGTAPSADEAFRFIRPTVVHSRTSPRHRQAVAASP
ncbi:hypothetical protein FQZ97_545560 [compost metagenome]